MIVPLLVTPPSIDGGPAVPAVGGARRDLEIDQLDAVAAGRDRAAVADGADDRGAADLNAGVARSDRAGVGDATAGDGDGSKRIGAEDLDAVSAGDRATGLIDDRTGDGLAGDRRVDVVGIDEDSGTEIAKAGIAYIVVAGEGAAVDHRTVDRPAIDDLDRARRVGADMAGIADIAVDRGLIDVMPAP